MAGLKSRIQDGMTIVEVSAGPESLRVILTVSKARYDEDAVQVALPKHLAESLGHLLLQASRY